MVWLALFHTKNREICCCHSTKSISKQYMVYIDRVTLIAPEWNERESLTHQISILICYTQKLWNAHYHETTKNKLQIPRNVRISQYYPPLPFLSCHNPFHEVWPILPLSLGAVWFDFASFCVLSKVYNRNICVNLIVDVP